MKSAVPVYQKFTLYIKVSTKNKYVHIIAFEEICAYIDTVVRFVRLFRGKPNLDCE